MGERLRIYGPFVEYKAYSFRYGNILLTTRYRFNSYDVKESNFFEGLDSPEDTVMGGAAINIILPYKMTIISRSDFDMLNRIGGFEEKLHLKKRIKWKMLSINPELGINVLSSKMANYDYGVPENSATVWRSSYYLNNGITWDVEISLMSMPFYGWNFNASAGIEFLGNEIKNSPLVDKEYIWKGLLIISRIL